MFLVGQLRDMGALEADVLALRQELLHRYVELLELAPLSTPLSAPPSTTQAPPSPARQPSAWQALTRYFPSSQSSQGDQGGKGNAGDRHSTVADAIDHGKTRPNVLESAFVQTWVAAVGRSLAVQWNDGEGAKPYFAMQDRNLQPIAQGVWASQSERGQLQLVLSLRWVNRAAVPIPVSRLSMVWAAVPASSLAGLGGLEFACDWDRPPVQTGTYTAQAVQTLEPGGVSELLACVAPATTLPTKSRFLAAHDAAVRGTERPRIVSHDLDDRQHLHHLEMALSKLAAQAPIWGQRRLASEQESGRSWRAAAAPLQAPTARQWAWAPNAGWPAATEKLKVFIGGSLAAFTLFFVGRLLRRSGFPSAAVGLLTLLAGGGFLALGLRGHMGGTGYDSPLYTGLALMGVAVRPLLLAVAALHLLYITLDDAGITWWHTVASGWRRALDLSSPTSKAEFWGFLVHAMWLWALARVCLVPLDLWASLGLALPFLALLVRRVRSLKKERTH